MHTIWNYLKKIINRANSSLVRRIFLINLTGLALLLFGIVNLTQFKEGLIDSKVQSLFVQGDIMAGAIAASATSDPDASVIDPSKLLDLKTGETSSFEDLTAPLEFPINPTKVAPLLRRVVNPELIRARVYDNEGVIVIDSSDLRVLSNVTRSEIVEKNIFSQSFHKILRFLRSGDLPSYHDQGQANGRGYPEVVQALQGTRASNVRVDEQGQIIVTVAVPIARLRGVVGAIFLTTKGDQIDATLFAERMNIFIVTGIALFVMLFLSYWLAKSIAKPMRELSKAAERVQNHVRERENLPDFTNRSDEIGQLSGALQAMTNALYNRIEATEKFAADVAHELKNPLTSLRSAVETLPLAKTQLSQTRLLEVISHDVKRLDRLITDIAKASRVDAQMARADSKDLNLKILLETVIEIANTTNKIQTKLVVQGVNFNVQGHDSRLGQVFNNLLDNARSFSPEGGKVEVRLTQNTQSLTIEVEDEGQGIPANALNKIFNRFYTDRPPEHFGQNSGLGLSICKQIIEAHQGVITAGNGQKGAIFTVVLPQ
jgi:two-component system, OmpR family, sensor histidine kinase ChvG